MYLPKSLNNNMVRFDIPGYNEHKCAVLVCNKKTRQPRRLIEWICRNSGWIVWLVLFFYLSIYSESKLKMKKKYIFAF